MVSDRKDSCATLVRHCIDQMTPKSHLWSGKILVCAVQPVVVQCKAHYTVNMEKSLKRDKRHVTVLFYKTVVDTKCTKSWENLLPSQKPADHNLKIWGCKITPLIFCHFFLAHTLRLSLNCWLVPYLAPGRNHPLNTGLPVTVLCVHRALGHLGTSLIWHWNRVAFHCQALTRHSSHLDASTTALCARRPWCYHPSVRERQTKRSGSRYVPPSAGSLYMHGLYTLEKSKAQWLGLFGFAILEGDECLSLP